MKRPVLAVFIALGWAATAWAAPPQPLKPFDVGHMAGRWYEIARLPNPANRDCQAGTTDWSAAGPGRFRITAVCRRGSANGPAKVFQAAVRITDPVTNAKVRMTLLGGLISNEYWLVDHADDYGWLIMCTPNGEVMAIMAPRPSLSPAVRAQVLVLVRNLGFDTTKLIFPIQPSGG
jgi:apolipoprotein D and lipocalin family protein